MELFSITLIWNLTFEYDLFWLQVKLLTLKFSLFILFKKIINIYEDVVTLWLNSIPTNLFSDPFYSAFFFSIKASF